MPLTQLLVDSIHALRNGAPAAGAVALHESRVIRQADRAARSAAPVLIEGEAGSGADALARAIHECSDRGRGPFIRCHAGAETGDPLPALAGRFPRANGGTLLIQDVDSLAPDDQSDLLRLLQDRGIGGAGLRRGSRADVRIVATSCGGLMERVRSGRFREDLYYRLHILPISLPPLRSRPEVIPEIARNLMSRFAAEEGKRLLALSPEAETLVTRYGWPGNVRQLENAVFRAVVLADGPRLTPAEFPQIAAQVQGYRIDIPPAPLSRAPEPVRDTADDEPDPHALRLMNESGEMRSLAELEAEIIRFALAHYGGHMSAISRHLGIGRSTLYRKLKELGLDNGMSDVAA